MTDNTLASRAAFIDRAFSSASGCGVVATDRGGLGLATVIAHKDQLVALTARVRERFGLELRSGPRRFSAGDVAFAGIGPGAWLAMRERGFEGFAHSLEATIGDVASVTDQSSGYAILRVTGPRLRDTLAKLVPLDLHARAFEPGDVASTTASHISATLWRLPDAVDGSPVFEIAVFRSFAASFWHALASSAAEFGLVFQEANSSRLE
jgi:heterotetrameric sarcosine oxidase gamma subunit